MSINVTNYVLDHKYTDNSIKGIVGVLSGKNCVIEGIDYASGTHTVHFKWTADDGTVRRQDMVVDDGDNIYTWYPYTEYDVDSIVIYGGSLYRCTVKHTSTDTFDTTKFDALISADGNYSIHDNYGELNQTLKPSDKRVAYCLNDYTKDGVTYKFGFYVYDGSWRRGTPEVLDRFTEIPIYEPDGVTIKKYELYFDGRRVITEDIVPYKIVSTYADIDVTVDENTMYFVENATVIGTTVTHYSGDYLYDATAKTITFIDEREDSDIDFNSEYTPVPEYSV